MSLQVIKLLSSYVQMKFSDKVFKRMSHNRFWLWRIKNNVANVCSADAMKGYKHILFLKYCSLNNMEFINAYANS